MKEGIHLGTLAQIVSGRLGVTVVFDQYANTASTDGKRIILPGWLTSAQARQGEEEKSMAVMRGFIAHEGAGHCSNTDFEEFRTVASISPLAHAIINIIEDIRIERAAWKRMPGIKRILNECVRFLIDEHFFDAPAPGEPPASAVTALLLLGLRHQELGQPIPDANVVQTKALAAKLFGQKLRDDIYATALRGSRSSSTAEVGQATRAILDLLKSAAEQNKQGQSGQSKKGESGEAGAASTQPGQQDASGASQDQQDVPDGKPKPRASAQSEPSQASQQQGQGQSEKGLKALPDAGALPQQPAHVAENAQKAVNAKESQTGKSALEDMAQESLRSVMHPTAAKVSFVEAVTPPASQPNWRPASEASQAARKMGAKLEQFLAAKIEDEAILVRSGQRLDPHRIARSRLMDLEVFEREGREAEGLDTAIMFVVDSSGSMNDKDAFRVAQDTAFALGQSLSLFSSQGVSCAMATFRTAPRWLKRFHESWPSMKTRLASITPAGSTNFPTAFNWAVGEMSKRKESRKILLMLTDGDTGQSQASAVRQTAELAGIEARLLFVNMEAATAQHHAKRDGFKHWGVALGAPSIPEGVFKALHGVF